MTSKEELKRLAYENACCRCQYYENEKCNNKDTCVWKQIEQDLEKLEKAIEIIRKKSVVIPLFERSKTKTFYNERVNEDMYLFEAEFNLLKEVFGESYAYYKNN